MKKLFTFFNIAGCIAAMMFTSSLHAHPTAHSQLEYLTHQIEDKPKDQNLLLQRAMVYIKEGNLELCLADLKQTEALGTRPDINAYYGHYYNARGDKKIALDYFAKHLAFSPQDFSVLETRAEIYRELQEWQNSIADYQQIIAKKAQVGPDYYLIVAELQDHLTPGQHNDTAILLQQGATRLQNPPQIIRRIVEYAIADKQFDNAIKWHNLLGDKIGRTAEWQAEQAKLYEQIGDLTKAREFYNAARIALQNKRQTPARNRLAAEIAVALKRLDDSADQFPLPLGEG